jgi:polyhydroxyalkanoate synthase
VSLQSVLNLTRRVGRPLPGVGQTPCEVVHRENKWRLLRYHARPEGLALSTPVVLVPSLINRHYVLDLMPGRSFVEYLVAQGHDVYTLDWGTPGDEDRYLSFDEITDRYLGRAFRVAARASASGRVHVLGYCLGGTLAAIHAAVHPERIASLTLLAAPVDFHDGGLLSQWTRTSTFDVRALVRGMGNVPWQLMQSAFQLLKPTLPVTKAVGLIERAWDDEFLDGFLAIERWGNDNVGFPGAAYQRYVECLYRDNALVRGTMTLRGRPARLQSITCPVLAVTFLDDHIVPSASAVAVTDLVSSADTTHLELRGGHVGAVVSRKAATTLWPQLSEFWGAREPSVAVA